MMSSALIRRLWIGRSRLRSRDFKNMSIFATIDKVTNIEYEEHKGWIAIGRLHAGVLRRGLDVQVCTTDETCRYVRVSELFVYEKFSRVAAEAVEAGDICAVCGIDDIQIGETIADKISGKPLPAIKVEEPTVKMAFSINTSPFVGREGKYVTSRNLRDRLYRELERNLAMKVEDGETADTFIISGRGTLHITILIENMRREGYGFMVGPPKVISKRVDDKLLEPYENISPGVKLWGVIAEVNEKDIVISLPGGLRGLVRASEAFDPISDNKVKDVETNFLSSIYHVGQLVSCIVLQLGDDKKEKGKRKIWLSLRLALLHKTLTLDVIQEGMVITAYVKSIEDHGYILHFGLPSFTGFMSKNSEAESREIRVNIGQLLQGVVKSVDKTRKVVYLSSDPDTVSKCVTKELKGISIDLLIPGMMVNARVQSTLENGIMLSFLTYFTGTVDIFHLQKAFPTSNWKDDYNQNKKVNARILFIDPFTRAVGLTLNPHLVHNKAPPFLVKTGDIFDHSKVIRVDRGFGLLLEVPTSPIPTPAYVSVSDVADKDVRKLEKNFKQGSHVRVRILGFRHLEGLAMGVLKSSAFEGSVFTHSDVKPAMVVRAKVTVVDNFGAIVQFPSGVKALCPLRHMSEFEIAKPRKKFQVGAELQFRVLGCKSKRITVTHKKTLVKSKLGIVSSYADATEGLIITHGWITMIENHGCFVRFYNGVQGFASR